ncbi:MAG TPA: ABC transporter permease [Gemmatimonadales bacterium]|nr:ABC transporter permease [Gemmatimonadales bacterium]
MIQGVWWRIAWRNLWRNRRRTLITASALAVGFFGAVLMVALDDGIAAEMVDNGTGVLTGQVQLHAREWRKERSLYATIGGDSGTDVAALLARVRAVSGVAAAAPRVWAGGLLSAGDRTEGVVLMGADFALERGVSRIFESFIAGGAPRERSKELAIGAELARKLAVRTGDVVVVVAPAADGSMGNDLFRISGIYRTGLQDLDGAFAAMPIATLQSLLALGPGRVHEVAVGLADPWAAAAAARATVASLGAAGHRDLEVAPWTVFSPQMNEYVALIKASNGLVVAIVFLFAIFGVANTSLMGTYERRREFAVVRALGVGPGGIARTVVYESVALGLLGLAAGAVITAPVMVWWHHTPLNLAWLFGDLEVAGALVRPVLRIEYGADGPILGAVGLLVTAVLAALYPAVRAARVPPADALAGR